MKLTKIIPGVKTIETIPGVGVNVDDSSVYCVGDKITFEGVYKFNFVQKFIRLFFKSAFEKSAPLKTFTVKESSATTIEIFPAIMENE